jgi:Flp pilus assembly protein TadD
VAANVAKPPRQSGSSSASASIAAWVALGVSLAAMGANLAFHPVPLYGTESDLLGEYIPAAREVGRLAIVPAHFTTKGPGFPALLALTAPIVHGDMFLAARAVNAAAAGLTVWLTFLLFANLIGEQIALAVALGLLVNPTYMRAAFEAGTDLPAMCLALGSLVLVVGPRTVPRLLISGSLAASAVLTRSNYIFLPVAAVLSLLRRTEERRGAAMYALGFLLLQLSWPVLCFATSGSIPHDTNYLNVAYAIYGSRLSWEDFLTSTASRFHSYLDVMTLRPGLVARMLATSLGTRWYRDASQLSIWPLGMLGVAGIAWCWRRERNAQLLWLNTLLAYCVLSLAFYAPRFSLFLLPFYLSGACLLLHQTGPPPLLAMQRHRRLWEAGALILLVSLYAVSAVVAVRQVVPLLRQAPYVTRDLGLALRRLDPEEAHLMARKPHVAYYSSKRQVPMPRLSSITDLIREANTQGVRYVSVTSVEAVMRPEYAALADSGLTLPGLRQVVFKRDRTGVSGAVYAVGEPFENDAEERRAVAESLTAGGSTVSRARHVAAATELLYAGEYKRALANLRTAEEQGPPDADIAALESNAYHALGAYEQAARACLRSMALSGATASHYDQLGRIRFKQGRFGEASRDFRIALEIDPGASERAYLLGLTEWSSGNYAAAAEGFRTYLRFAPGDVEARKLAALSLARSGDARGAVRLIEDGRMRGEIGPADLRALADSLGGMTR